MTFTIRDVLLTTALVAVSLGWLIDRSRREPLPATPPAAPPSTNRYELTIAGPNDDRFYLLDTTSGTCWERNSSDGRWLPHSPAVSK